MAYGPFIKSLGNFPGVVIYPVFSREEIAFSIILIFRHCVRVICNTPFHGVIFCSIFSPHQITLSIYVPIEGASTNYINSVNPSIFKCVIGFLLAGCPLIICFGYKSRIIIYTIFSCKKISVSIKLIFRNCIPQKCHALSHCIFCRSVFSPYHPFIEINRCRGYVPPGIVLKRVV